MRPARAVVLAGSVAAGAAGAGETPGAAAGAQPVSPILSQVLSQLKPTQKQAANDNEPPEAGLFGRYAQQNKSAAAEGKASAAPVSKLVPALGYAMEQLDPGSFAVIRPVPVGGSGPLLRTGDVFVVQFSTNLPGQVRLENIDPAGKTVDLGLYTVLVDQLNRLPRDKGIQLQGQPGVERLRFHFYPCLPAEAAGKPWAAEFKGRLPACAATPTALSSTVRNLAGVITPRALVNLSQPDANVAFAASPEYQPGEVTLMEARIRHESRSHGR